MLRSHVPHRLRAVVSVGLIGLSACAGPPPRGIPDSTASTASYPSIVPLDPLLRAADTAVLTPGVIAATQAEGARTKARADALRARPVGEPVADRSANR